MTELRFEDYEIIAADLGDENLMPDIKNVEYIHAGFKTTDRVPNEEATGLGRGMINTILPYTLQDNYNRNRRAQKFNAAILENDKLRAVILPQIGGRLWSLYDKVQMRELLYVNPVFQPANLAIRNAWFSGGVEWNIGIKGHNPLTCSPMFACETKSDKGEPILRLYEYERIRDIVYYMDFCIPEGSDMLYVKTTVENTAKSEKYMYWWSNIAVPEYDGTRVIAPCSDALESSYNENSYVVDMVDIPVPQNKGFDVTYPKNLPRSQDYFFRVPEKKRKWVAAINRDGNGLLQFSTPELMGRKLFVWGQGDGGKNWSHWLSGEEQAYIEIQAGLARTQLEHIIMPAQSEISFVEGYGAVHCNPDDVFADYPRAINAVEDFLLSHAPADIRNIVCADTTVKPDIKQYGSCWGYLENRMREVSGKSPISRTVEFPSDTGDKRGDVWLTLLQTGEYPDLDLNAPPSGFEVSKPWLKLLEKQIESGRENAAALLHYGLALYANGDISGAYAAFEKSVALKPNAWGYRNLSMIEKNEYNNPEKALFFIQKALQLNLTYRGLIINAADVMLYSKKYDEWLGVFEKLDKTLKADGRILLYRAIALMNTGHYRAASDIINPDFELCDIKEGELSISYIWGELYAKILSIETGITDEDKLRKLAEERYPLPVHLDFRMHK